MRATRSAAISFVALVLATAACSNDMNQKDSASTAGAPAAEAYAPTAAAAASSAPAAPADGGSTAGGAIGDGQNIQPGPDSDQAKPTPAAPVVRGRVATGREDIIKIAAISVEAKDDDVDAAVNKAQAAAKVRDAQISSAARSGTGKQKRATLVFRVLPTDFDEFVGALSNGDLGEVVDTKITTEDVTGQVADIEGRIRAAQDSADKIRALIARADKITDLVTLEREYAARDAEIQSMTSQVASLKDRAGRSTVSLNIGPVTEKPKEAAKPEPEEKGFMGGLKAGWKAFTATTVVLTTALGALLPFLVVVAIALLVWWIIRRRRPLRVKPTPTLDPATPYATPAP